MKRFIVLSLMVGISFLSVFLNVANAYLRKGGNLLVDDMLLQRR